ncbi:MAG TPA: roadblock/LC7 domain-containing protein [Thermoplasmata archaeon]|nr:roadblock/LC7 domain-containing protein [Thermoplasmata archaeon]
MTDGAHTRFIAILQELRRIPDVVAVALARRDGLLIAHLLPKNMDPKRIAAMAAAIVGTSEMAADEMGLGSFFQSIVDSGKAKMLATGAGEEGILITIVRTDANMGLVLLSVGKAVQAIEELLERTAVEVQA